MKFEKDAKKVGQVGIFAGVVVLSVLGILQIFVFTKPDVPMAVIVISWLVGLLIGGRAILYGRKLIQNGGKWKIEINSERFIWSSPKGSKDNDFDLKLSDIEMMEKRVRARRGKTGSSSYYYYLMMKSGEEIELKAYSSVNLNVVMKELEKNGVKTRSVRVGDDFSSKLRILSKK